MSQTRRTAVSYTRFSALKQGKGDSEERQENEYRAFCERHNLAPGKEVFIDRGRSGYHGTHRKRGALGVLVQAAKDGRFEPGTVIVVEAWDRLGRLRPDKQIELISELLQTGVDIGVCRLNEVFTLEDFGTHRWTTLSVFISLAYNESKQKADRLRSVWTSRRKRVREDGAKLGGSLPGWVERVRSEFRLIPERAAAVSRIYQLATDGEGVTRITRALAEEKVKPFKHPTWTKAFVAQLLRDRRVIGEYQPKKRVTGKDDIRRAEVDGPVVSDYYPAAVTQELFALARAAQAQKGKKRTRQRKYANVFRGMLTNAADGEPMNMANAQGRGTCRLILKSAGVNGGTVTIPYEMFERCILDRLRELRAADVLPAEGRPAGSADTIRAKLREVRADLASIKGDLAAKYSKGLSDTLRLKEDEELALVNELSDELARTAKPLDKAWDDAAGLLAALDAAEDKDAMRIRIRAALAAIVESAVVLVMGTKSARTIVVQFDFVGGRRRTWVIRYRPASGGIPNPPEPEVESAAWGTEADGVDIRKPADAKRVGKVLIALDSAKLSEALAAGE